MSLATSIIIGSLVFGTGMGFRGCSKPAKYKVGDCVRSVDSFGEFKEEYIDKIIKFNDKDYKVKVWSPKLGYFMEQTTSIDITDDPKYKKQVECPE